MKRSRCPVIREKSQRGFALIFVLSSVALLFTFLMAAQTSVMSGKHHVRRAVDRLEAQEKLNILLQNLSAQAREEIREGKRKPGEDWAYANGDGVLILEAEDPLYTRTAGLKPRRGDVVVTLAPRPGLSEKERRFLINTRGRRPSALALD